MKNLLTILLLSATTIAFGQSTEIGIAGGASFHISSGHPADSKYGYYSAEPALYIHFESKKRISYELSVAYWERNLSEGYYPDWGGYQHISIYEKNKYYDASVTGYYNLHKALPFDARRTQQYIGFSLGVLLNAGQLNVTRNFSDTNLIWQDTYGATPGILPYLGLGYIFHYSLTKHIDISSEIYFKMLLPSDNYSEYAIDQNQQSSFASIKIGIGYKFFHVKQNINNL